MEHEHLTMTLMMNLNLSHDLSVNQVSILNTEIFKNYVKAQEAK